MLGDPRDSLPEVDRLIREEGVVRSAQPAG